MIMKEYKMIISAVILSVGLAILGGYMYRGMNDIANRGRKVTVKGLSEKIVPADLVTWPIAIKEAGNNLEFLYLLVERKNEIIKEFLLSEGVTEDEIAISSPEVADKNVENYYSSEKINFRYTITSVVTVKSKNIDLIRSLMAREGELLKKGIVISHDNYYYRARFDYTSFNEGKPEMMAEAIENAQKTAEQFAKNSHSKLDKIIHANQGQFSIVDQDSQTPHIKKIRVVTTITYSLKN